MDGPASRTRPYAEAGVLQRMLSRPRAPGKRPAAVREGRELSVLEGRAKEKANAKHSWPSRLWVEVAGRGMFRKGLERCETTGNVIEF